jgi:hypothetical protein
VLALLGVLTLGLAGGAVVYAAAGKPDFTLGVNPVSQSVQQGQQAVYSVTVTATGGFTGAVALSATGKPSGSTVGFSPSTVTLSSSASSGTSTLTVTTASSTPVGTYQITITGVSGKLSHSTTVSLTVNYALSQSFSLSVTPASVTVPAGSTAVYTLTITRTNFTGPVTLGVAGGLPAGAAASFSPNPTTGGSTTLQISTSATATPDGTSTIYVVGSAAIGSSTRYAYAQAQLVVSASRKPFAITGDLPARLAPGVAPVPLDLVLQNPNNQSLAITNLTVTVAGTSAGAACDSSNFTVVQFTGPYPVTVAAGQTASLSQLGVPSAYWPRVGMLDLPRNQDACKGVSITLSYSGAGQGA